MSWEWWLGGNSRRPRKKVRMTCMYYNQGETWNICLSHVLLHYMASFPCQEWTLCGCSYRHSASTFSHHAQHHCLPMLALAEHFTISKLCMTTKWLYVACHIPTLFWYCPALYCVLRTMHVARVQVQCSSLLIKCSHTQCATYNIHS